ncbi:DUF1049 domain-containing protein [bacterium]|nr:DUF1049 domain-containing protein [candidate division CSSED10-310 bacterium]
MNNKIKLIVSLSLMSLVLILVFQNVDVVNVRLFFWTLPVSGALLFIILLFSGGIIGGSLLGYFQHRKKSTIKTSD